MATVYQDIYFARDSKFAVHSEQMPEDCVRIVIKGYGKTGLVLEKTQLAALEQLIVAARAGHFTPERKERDRSATQRPQGNHRPSFPNDDDLDG